MPVRRSLPTILLAAAAAAALPSAADARRAPTELERIGVAAAARIPARCLKIRVSTVNERWAATTVRNGKRSCRRWQADGIAVFAHPPGRRWRFVTAGSAFSCPVPRVPPRVARDLGIRCYDERAAS